MQQKIDSYDMLAINFMIESGEDVNCPILCKAGGKMLKIWKWIKEHKDNK